MNKTILKLWCATLLTIVAAPSISGQLVKHERLLSFEDTNVPQYIKSTKSKLSITGDHYKDGTQSLRWDYKPGATITINKDLKFESVDSTGVDTYLSTFVVWVYNEKPVKAPLKFEFLKDKKVCSHFEMGMDFTGWRAAFVCYERDMQGTPVEGMNNIRITAPNSTGTLHLDHLLTAAKMDHRYQTADVQVPFVNAATQSHWLVLYKGSKLTPDIDAEATVSESQRQDMATIAQRFKDMIYTPGTLSDKELDAIRKEYSTYGITRNDKGEIKGLPVFFGRHVECYERIMPDYNNNLFAKNGMELKNYFNLMNRMAIAYNNAMADDNTTAADEIKGMYLNMYDHVVDQGVAWGSCMGDFTHYGYSFRNYYPALFLMKDVLADTGRLAAAQDAMRWYSIVNEVYIKPTEAGMDMDAFNTNTTGRIASILMMDDTPDKVVYLKSFARWIDNGCLPAQGLNDSFKSDGCGYHHCNNYPAYTVGGLDGATKMVYLLSRTGFAVTPLAHNTLRNVLLTMRFYCNKLEFPLAMSGRHPDGKGRIVPMHYATLAQAGMPDGSSPLDTVMANAYLRLATNRNTPGGDGEAPEYMPTVSKKHELAMIQKFIDQGCTPEGDPQGNITLGYACASAHRHGNWSAVARGNSRYLWAAEHYRGENLYGRYLAHGSLQIATAPNPDDNVSLDTSRWTEAGFDWGRIPGATATYLPMEQLKAVVLNVDKYSGYEEMLYSDETFAGAVSQEGANGNYGIKLHEHDKYNGSLRARKSYHFMGDKIVCLGSGIENADNEHSTETTVFQTALLDDTDRAYWDSPIQGDNYMMDHINTGYYLPDSHNIVLEKTLDRASESNEGKPTHGDWVTMTLNHGTAPQDASYHYAIMPCTTADKLIAMASKPGYDVLCHDNNAHIVADNDMGLTSYVIFEAGCELPDGHLLQHVDAPCLAMTHRHDDASVTVSVTNPDLALYTGPSDEAFTPDGKRIERSIYSRPWTGNKSQTAPVQVTVAGKWKLAADTADCRIISTADDTTTLQFNCHDAAPLEAVLVR